MPIRLDIKGPPKGHCNICGEYGKLTEDHIPPKSCRGIAIGEIRELHSKLVGSGSSPAPRRIQAGPYFRTLCLRCNGLLGTQFDPALAETVRQVRAFVHTTLRLPPRMQLRIQPQRVMRSVIGHVAAHGLNGFKIDAEVTLPLKEYVLDTAKPLPDIFRVYYWLYPYRSQVVMKWAGITNLDGTPPVIISILKFFPLAFMVTLNEGSKRRFSLPNFDGYRGIAVDETHDVAVPLGPLLSKDWPEWPSDNDRHVVLSNNANAHVTKPLTRIVPA